MGRALFSERYLRASAAVRVEPESAIPSPGKWSLSNRFDPDADEFFMNAEFEAFCERGAVDTREHPLDGSDTSDSDSGRESPAIDPATEAIVQGIFADMSPDADADVDAMPMAIDEPEPQTPPSVAAELPFVTPSPPPSVTPRTFYVWPSSRLTSPPSPSVRRTHSPAGPLTNPNARQSLARLGLPTRLRA